MICNPGYKTERILVNMLRNIYISLEWRSAIPIIQHPFEISALIQIALARAFNARKWS